MVSARTYAFYQYLLTGQKSYSAQHVVSAMTYVLITVEGTINHALQDYAKLYKVSNAVEVRVHSYQFACMYTPISTWSSRMCILLHVHVHVHIVEVIQQSSSHGWTPAGTYPGTPCLLLFSIYLGNYDISL